MGEAKGAVSIGLEFWMVLACRGRVIGSSSLKKETSMKPPSMWHRRGSIGVWRKIVRTMHNLTCVVIACHGQFIKERMQLTKSKCGVMCAPDISML